MKRKRLILILLMAVTSGILAGYLALDYLGNQPALMASTQPEQPRNRIALAARDLPQGAVLREEDVRVVNWSAAEMPEGYASSPAELVGRGLTAPIRANEPLLATKLADRESGGGLPILIREGMRAVSVRVDDVVAVAGFVIPGTRVDVMVTIQPDEGQNQNIITRVVLQNVQVLASGQTVSRDEEGKPQTVSVVTLLVSPEDGERLVLASNQGRIQLALRSMLDVEDAVTAGARVANLVNPGTTTPARPSTGRRVAPTTRQPASTSTTVETIRGGQRTLNTFSGNE